jgi:hypothetical protein
MHAANGSPLPRQRTVALSRREIDTMLCEALRAPRPGEVAARIPMHNQFNQSRIRITERNELHGKISSWIEAPQNADGSCRPACCAAKSILPKSELPTA